jgi:CRP-like cAMP-binding protein
VPLFAGFSKRHLQHLADATDEVRFPAGASIVEEGNLGETLFVVLEGQAKVVRGRKVRTRLVPGDFFGEVSVLDGGPRTASVVAETPVAALRLFRHTVLELMESEPQFALALLEGIARRIREIDRSLGR